jgi:hypothetical protein
MVCFFFFGLLVFKFEDCLNEANIFATLPSNAEVIFAQSKQLDFGSIHVPFRLNGTICSSVKLLVSPQ